MEKFRKKIGEGDQRFGASRDVMKKALCVCGMLITFLFATKMHAAIDPLPGAATPGGAMPRIQQPTVPGGSMPSVVIPPLRERPLGADEGTQIMVKQFELVGVVARPGLINVAEVQELVEIQRQKWLGKMTLGQMQLVADEVTNYYRSHGLILARAYIPAQIIADDVIMLTVLEGKLGAVFSEGGSPPAASAEGQAPGAAGNLRYSKEMLQKPFVQLQGQPVIKEAFEGALLQLVDYPGLKYNAVVQPGTVAGTADLYLKVTEERLFSAALSLDNYGSEYTGEYRPRVDMRFYNPTKAADKLYLTLLATIDPGNDLYGEVMYERPLPWGKNSLGIDYSRNAFDVGGDLKALGLAGESEILEVFLRHTFKRSRGGNVHGLLSFASKTANTSQDVTIAEDDLSVLSTGLLLSDYMDQWLGGGVTNLNMKVSAGFDDFLGSNDNDDIGTSRVGGSGEKAPSEFWKFNAELSRLQKLWPNTSLFVRLTGQATDSMLVSVEQFALGGPDTVRAYPQAEYLMDQGYFSSVELVFNAPGFSDRPAFFNRTWGELLQVSIFYDAASGWLNDPLANEEGSGYLSGVGVGGHFALPGRFTANLSVATPTGSHEAENDRDWFTYFKITGLY